MSGNAPFVILREPCDQAVNWAVSRLEQAGFRIVRTFDLQTARLAHMESPCPQHGSAQCNCQMVVLLVYQPNYPPATMVVHGSDASSYFYLMDLPQPPVGKRLETNIRQVIDRQSCS